MYVRTDLNFDHFLSEFTGPDEFLCTPSVTTRLNSAVILGITNTRNLAGEKLPISSPVCAPTGFCPPAFRAFHAAGDATHFVSLSQNMIRVAELAGLFGVNLSGSTGFGTIGRKASVAVKSLPSISPLGGLNFVAIRQGSGSSLRREIHLHSPQTGANGTRIVQSLVDGEHWDNLAFRARLGVTYVLMKTRWFEASLHRQWGKQATINWIIGLCNFYKDHTGLRLGIGDISHIMGEAMTDHASHRLGRDVDAYVLDYLGWGPYPEAFWCNNTATSFTMTSMLPPTNPGGTYNPSGGIQLAGACAAEIWRRYAIVLAYCFATWSVLKTFTWHGVWQPQLQTNAMAIAQAAFDTGWQSSWGPVPKSRADLAPSIVERNQKLIGQGSSLYGTGKAWPLHQDHMHIRLDL